MSVRRITHDGLSFEIDEGWVDASQIAYLAPPDTSLADDFARRATAAGAPKLSEAPANPLSRGNFVLAFRPAPGSDEGQARELLERELRNMVGLIPGAKPSELRWGTMAGQEAAILEIELKLEALAAHQLHALARVGDRLFHFCGTSSGKNFDQDRDRFERIMASIRTDS